MINEVNPVIQLSSNLTGWPTKGLYFVIGIGFQRCSVDSALCVTGKLVFSTKAHSQSAPCLSR